MTSLLTTNLPAITIILTRIYIVEGSFMKIFKPLLAGIMMFFIFQIFPVCPEIEVWSNGANYRYLIKDSHRDYVDGRTSIKQQADILWAAQQIKTEDVFILAEDTSTYSGNNPKMHSIYEFAPDTIEDDIAFMQKQEGINQAQAIGSMNLFDLPATPFARLINTCKKLGITNYNAECSQSINAFQWKNLANTQKISAQEVIQDLEYAIEEMKNNPFLALAYTLLSEGLIKLKTIASTNDTKAFVTQAMEIRHLAVNARTIHKLSEWNNIKHGFICEGFNHIEAIKSGLQALGYKQIQSIGNKKVWTPPQSADEFEERTKQLLSEALNLRETFQQIFHQQ